MNELVSMLVSKLGVNEGQAQGGTGLILNLAKEQLGKQDFSQISQSIPGISDLLKAAPQQEDTGGGGLLGMVGKLAGSLGGGSELGQLASLAGGFEKLGIKPEMIAQFLPIIVSFVEKKGGSTVADLLKGAIGGASK
jgi:hypothetical protein